jgi:hypothetical protein
MPYMARVRDFTAEQVAAGALREADEAADAKNRAAVRAVVRAAAPLIVAANRLVLPEPMSRDDDRDPIAWEPEGIDGQVSAHPDEGEVDFEYWSWSPAAARALAVSLLAAADYVEFQASELRKEGQADG